MTTPSKPDFYLGSRLDGPFDFDGQVCRCYLLGRPQLDFGLSDTPRRAWWVRVEPPLPPEMATRGSEVLLLERDGVSDIAALKRGYVRVLVYSILDPGPLRSGKVTRGSLGEEHPFAEVALNPSELQSGRSH